MNSLKSQFEINKLHTHEQCFHLIMWNCLIFIVTYSMKFMYWNMSIAHAMPINIEFISNSNDSAMVPHLFTLLSKAELARRESKWKVRIFYFLNLIIGSHTASGHASCCSLYIHIYMRVEMDVWWFYLLLVNCKSFIELEPSHFSLCMSSIFLNMQLHLSFCLYHLVFSPFFKW